MKNNKAFTMIELIIIVGIIAILAALAFISYQNAQASARDAKRKSDASAIASALELFWSDNKRYPTIAGPAGVKRAGCLAEPPATCDVDLSIPPYNGQEQLDGQRWKALQTTLLNYLSPLPVDPRVNQTLPGINEKMGYYYYDSDITTTTPACSGAGHCYTIFVGPTETDQSEENFCQVNTTQLGSIPTGRYICLKK